jgi:protoporphyrinogen oxidase
LFNTDKISFWNIRALEHKLNRFKVGQINSDNKLQNKPERLGEKYKAEISKINEILARPLYDIRYTTVKRPFEKINNFDTTV